MILSIFFDKLTLGSKADILDIAIEHDEEERVKSLLLDNDIKRKIENNGKYLEATFLGKPQPKYTLLFLRNGADVNSYVIEDNNIAKRKAIQTLFDQADQLSTIRLIVFFGANEENIIFRSEQALNVWKQAKKDAGELNSYLIELKKNQFKQEGVLKINLKIASFWKNLSQVESVMDYKHYYEERACEYFLKISNLLTKGWDGNYNLSLEEKIGTVNGLTFLSRCLQRKGEIILGNECIKKAEEILDSDFLYLSLKEEKNRVALLPAYIDLSTWYQIAGNSAKAQEYAAKSQGKEDTNSQIDSSKPPSAVYKRHNSNIIEKQPLLPSLQIS